MTGAMSDQTCAVPSALATSSAAMIELIGVRRSWLASETNCRRAASACSTRASIAFMVVASSAISSFVGGTATRAVSWPRRIRRAVEVMLRTERSELPTRAHVPRPTPARSTGNAAVSRRVTVRMFRMVRSVVTATTAAYSP